MTDLLDEMWVLGWDQKVYWWVGQKVWRVSEMVEMMAEMMAALLAEMRAALTVVM